MVRNLAGGNFNVAWNPFVSKKEKRNAKLF